jgi:hypothetical protein
MTDWPDDLPARFAVALRDAYASTGIKVLPAAAAVLDPGPAAGRRSTTPWRSSAWPRCWRRDPDLMVYGAATRVAAELGEPMVSVRSVAQGLADK